MEDIGQDIDIVLLPEGDEKSNAELHGKHPEFRRAAEQTNYGDRLFTRANVIGVTHGTLSGTDPATLLILEFRFISMQKGRRFTSCTITAKFEDSDGDAELCPEVWDVVPDGVYALHKTETRRTVKISATGSLQGTFSTSMGPSIGISWERKKSDKVEDWTQLTGSRYQMGSEERDDAVIWSMQENGATKNGIPTFMRAAILVRRSANVPFKLTIEVKAKVDFSVSQKVADLKRLFGKPTVVRVPPRPVGINTAVDPEVDLTRLDDLDIAQFADVALISDEIASKKAAASVTDSIDRGVGDICYNLLVVIHGVTDPAPVLEKLSQIQTFFSAAFPSTSVIEFQFPKIPFNQSSTSTDIKQQARLVNEELLGKLSQEDNENSKGFRSKTLPVYPLIFMGHDLGGCLIKEILLLATREPQFQPTRLRVKGIIFVGTPHRGANVTFWEHHIIHLLPLSRIACGSPSQLLQTLPQQLYDSAEDFTGTSWDFETLNLFQRGKGRGYSPMDNYGIDETFASLDSQKAKSIGLNGSHAQLWEFRLGDSKTEMVCKELSTMLKSDKLSATQTFLQSFLGRLSQLSPKTYHSSTARPAINSVDWILEDKSYLDWKSETGVGILHVSGPAGSGTTVLATHILKLALEARGYHQTAILSYCFNKYDDQARTQRSAFISFTRQLLLARPALLGHVQPLCHFMLQQKLFNKDILWSLLSSLLVHCTEGVVYCIVHAIHECDEPLDQVIQSLSKIVQGSSGTLKIILTSDDVYASNYMQHCPCLDGTCRSIISGSRRDTLSAVITLARENVTRVARDNPLWAQFEEDIITMLCKQPASHISAMHRLALLESSSVRSTRHHVGRKLEKLRHFSFELSRGSFNTKYYGAWVGSAFRWVLHAMRPLTVAELSVAVAFEEFRSKRLSLESYDIYQLSPERLPDLDKLSEWVPQDIVGDLTRRAGPLIKLDGDRVVPVHKSIRELLYDAANDNERVLDRQYSIFSTCLEYLKYASLRHSADSYNPNEQVQYANALLNYAVAYWPDHYKSVSLDFQSHAKKLVDVFLGDESCFSFWTCHYNKRKDALPFDLKLSNGLREQVICRFGLRKQLEALMYSVVENDNTSENTNQLQIAIDQAAEFGHLELVHMLLRGGTTSRRALSLAAKGGHKDVVSALLNANPSSIVWGDEGTGYTALHYAVCSGDRATVEILVNMADIALDAQTSDGSSALNLASRTGQTLMVRMLIDRGTHITITENDGYDALKLAARGGFDEIVHILLDYGANPQTPAADGNTAIHLATQFGHPIVLNDLLREGTDVNCTNKNGLTPLHIAVAEGYVDLLKMLLDAQQARSEPIPLHVDYDKEATHETHLLLIYNFPMPPLQKAAMNGRSDVVEVLLEDKAGHRMEDCCRAMFVAASYGLVEVTKKLLDHGSVTEVRDEYGNTILHQAVEGGDTKVLEMLLIKTSEMTNVNTPNQSGQTALHKAAEMGSLAMVEKLLQNEADVDALTSDDETPLHFAARDGHQFVVESLLKRMTDVEKRDINNKTPFTLAAERGHIVIVKILLRSKKGLNLPFHSPDVLKQPDVLKALLNCKNGWDCSEAHEANSGKTPLHLAVELDLIYAVQLLFEAGADINARCEGNQTPLFVAAITNKVKITSLLLACSAEVDIPDDTGRTPLFAASERGHAEIVRALLLSNRKPDVNHVDRRGWVPLYAAADEEVEITKLLLDGGADPRRKTEPSGMTPFARACFTDKRLEVVRYYLQDHANKDLPNIPDSDGQTAVHRSTIGGSLRVMKELIWHKADLNVQGKDGRTPLHIAITMSRMSRMSMARVLLDGNIDISKHSSPDGTVLMAAAAAGAVEIAELLYEKGVDVNETCEPYHTALNAAANCGHLNMVKWLLHHDAKSNLAGGKYGNPISAALGGLYDTVAIVRQLVEVGNADINYITEIGDSVLRIAVRQGLTDVVKFIVQHGARSDDDQARQPLILEAVQSGQVSMVKALLQNHEHLKVKDAFGRQLLSVAIESSRDNIAEYLLGLPSDIDIGLNNSDHAGRTPLILCLLKRSATLSKLLSRQPDIDATDCEKKTALAYACILDLKSSVSSLLEAGANPSVRDCRDRSPLYWACRCSSIEIVEDVLGALKKSNADYPGECAAAIPASVASDRRSFLQKLLTEILLVKIYKALKALLEARPKYRPADEASTGHPSLEIMSEGGPPGILQQDLEALRESVADHRPAAIAIYRRFLRKEGPFAKSHIGVDGWTPWYTAERYGSEPMMIMLRTAGFGEEIPPEQSEPELDNPARDGPTGGASSRPEGVVGSKTKEVAAKAKQLRSYHLPSSWSAVDKTPCLIIDGKTTVTVGDGPLTPGDEWPLESQATVRADFPMSPIKELNNIYYFEVTIEKNEKPGHWCIGFCEEVTRLNLALGWGERSWAWHGDDGLLFDEDKDAELHGFSDAYGASDTIGCGVDFDNESAFYTRNGRVIGKAFSGIRGKLYPAVSAKQSMRGAKLSTKFWTGSKDDFVFKGFGDPATGVQPGKVDRGVELEDNDVHVLGEDGRVGFDMELLDEEDGSDAEVR
ncbi:hypothetical protein VE03_03983 [Pseudogymnoascus sp. 23342-1-I1]|nr:hypothetical protein VE03_03983 [Pseudogymnoascus sp. 23342-1-I1]